MLNVTKILYPQPLLFNQSEEAYDNCRIFDERIYRPFYKTGDKITFAFIGYVNSSFPSLIAYTAKITNGTNSTTYNATVGETVDSNKKVFYFNIDSSSFEYADTCGLEIEIYSSFENGDGTTVTLEATSQVFDISTSVSCSKYIEFTNTNNDYGLYFNGGTFKYAVRLYVLLWKPKYKSTITKIPDSKGDVRILSNRSQSIYEFRVDDIPEYLHDLLRIAKDSDFLYIDTARFESLEDDYTPEWKDIYKFAQASINIKPYNSDRLKRNC